MTFFAFAKADYLNFGKYPNWGMNFYKNKCYCYCEYACEVGVYPNRKRIFCLVFVGTDHTNLR